MGPKAQRKFAATMIKSMDKGPQNEELITGMIRDAQLSACMVIIPLVKAELFMRMAEGADYSLMRCAAESFQGLSDADIQLISTVLDS